MGLRRCDLDFEVIAATALAAAHSALDQALYSTLHAIPPVPCFPLSARPRRGQAGAILRVSMKW